MKGSSILGRVARKSKAVEGTNGVREEEETSNPQDRENNNAEHEWTLKEMYLPPSASDKHVPERDWVDLVFVHGLGGNLKGTWKQVGTNEPWFAKPEFLGDLKERVRVLSFGYNANRFANAANTRIINHANSLLRNLVLTRLRCPDRPIIFIAHSLGGLVVKRAILLCATRDEWAPIKASIRSVVFLGTPHMGSDQAKSLVFLQKLTAIVQFQDAWGANLSQELTKSSTTIQDINMEFTPDVHRHIELLCCYESQPQRLPNGSKEIIVPQSSAVLPGVANLDLNCTHSELSKFSSPTEARFLKLWLEVKRLVIKSQQQERLPGYYDHLYDWVDERSTKVIEFGSHSNSRSQSFRKSRRGVSNKGSKLPKNLIQSTTDKIIAEMRVNLQAGGWSQGETWEPQVSPKASSDDALEELDDFLQLLRPVTFDNLGLQKETPYRKTCHWFDDEAKFGDWLISKKTRLLFVTGNPGCGKSHMAKHIQAVLEKKTVEGDRELGHVVSFYCDNYPAPGVDPPILDHLLRFALKTKRLSTRLKQRLRSIVAADMSSSEAKLPFSYLMEILQLLFEKTDGSNTYLIVDGLDQCADQFILSFLGGLDSMFRTNGCSELKVIITTRVNENNQPFTLKYPQIEMSPAKVWADIATVVEDQVDDICIARRIHRIDKAFVARRIVERANGSFLFAMSVLKELRRTQEIGPDSIYEMLSRCPTSMQQMYQHDMEELGLLRPDILKLVQFLGIAGRPLYRAEAWNLLRQANKSLKSDFDFVGEMKVLCPRLITLHPRGTIEIVHRTLHEFIMDTYNMRELHSEFAKNCLNSMQIASWETELFYRNTRGVSRDAFGSEPPTNILDYAANHLSHHLFYAEEFATPIAWDVWNFLSSRKGNLWQTYTSPINASPIYGSPTKKPLENHQSMSLRTPLMILASWDVADIIQEVFCASLEPQPRNVLNVASDILLAFYSKPSASEAQDLEVLMHETVNGVSAAHFAALATGRVLELLLPFIDDVDQCDDNGHTLLQLAAAGRNIKGVRLLLEQGADTDAVDMWGESALHRALQTGHRGIVQLLLEHQANPNIQSVSGLSPLEIAVCHNDVENAKLLIDAGADVTQRLTDGLLPGFSALDKRAFSVLEALIPYINLAEHMSGMGLIHYCAYLGLDNIVQQLIKLGVSPDKVDLQCPFPATFFALILGQFSTFTAMMEAGATIQTPLPMGMTLLHLAVRQGNSKVCETLLSYGSDVNALNTYHGTALGYASSQGNDGLVNMLLQYGADPNVLCGSENDLFDSPLILAGSNEIIVKTLLKAGASPVPTSTMQCSSFHIACWNGYLGVMKAIVDKSNAAELLGLSWGWQRTPLYEAATGGRLEAFEWLLDQGLSLDQELEVKLLGNKTLLHAAAEGGNIEILRHILQVLQDPDINSPDDEGGTSLYYACLHGQEAMVEFLLNLGARTDISGQGGNLLVAATKGSAKTANCIMELYPKLDVESTNADGLTPLMLAARYRSKKTVKALLNRGVQVNRRATDGRCALSIAIDHNKRGTLKTLLLHDGIDVLQQDSFGRNALQIAQNAGHSGLTAIILSTAGTPTTHEKLMDNKDIFGLTAYDYTNPNIASLMSREVCLKGIHDTVAALLVDLSGRGCMWEKLGKYLLRVSGDDFAEIAFQRSIKHADLKPSMMRYNIDCRYCLETIRETRYTCKICLCVDLCTDCVRQRTPGDYTAPEDLNGICRNHSFFKIRIPWPVTQHREVCGPVTSPALYHAPSQSEDARRALSKEYGGRKIADQHLHRYLKEVLQAFPIDDSSREHPEQHFSVSKRQACTSESNETATEVAENGSCVLVGQDCHWFICMPYIVVRTLPSLRSTRLLFKGFHERARRGEYHSVQTWSSKD